MQRRQLGKDGPEISVIGFGAWAIGGSTSFYSWGPIDDDVAVRAIQRALDLGYNWIDTAAIYGLGHSEEVVNRAIQGRRDGVFVATKCVNVWDENGAVSQSGHPESIKRECEQSLARLGIDHIDLYQLHGPTADVPVEETWGAMCELQDAGKVRCIGVSNYNVELMRRCMAIRQIQSLQPPYNYLHREIEAEILPYCLENGIGVISYGPMREGLLSGTFSMDRVADDDLRHRDDFQRDLPRALSAVESMGPLAARHGWTPGQLAIAWVLSHPAITSAIVGGRTPEQVEQNAVPGYEPIPEALRDEVETALTAVAAG